MLPNLITYGCSELKMCQVIGCTLFVFVTLFIVVRWLQMNLTAWLLNKYLRCTYYNTIFDFLHLFYLFISNI